MARGIIATTDIHPDSQVGLAPPADDTEAEALALADVALDTVWLIDRMEAGSVVVELRLDVVATPLVSVPVALALAETETVEVALSGRETESDAVVEPEGKAVPESEPAVTSTAMGAKARVCTKVNVEPAAPPATVSSQTAAVPCMAQTASPETVNEGISNVSEIAVGFSTRVTVREEILEHYRSTEHSMSTNVLVKGTPVEVPLRTNVVPSSPTPTLSPSKPLIVPKPSGKIVTVSARVTVSTLLLLL